MSEVEIHARFEVSTSVLLRTQVFWHATLCHRVSVSPSFKGTLEDDSIMFLRKVRKHYFMGTAFSGSSDSLYNLLLSRW
jgi:hypothetical protein